MENLFCVLRGFPKSVFVCAIVYIIVINTTIRHAEMTTKPRRTAAGCR